MISESREAQSRHNSYLTENFVSALEKRLQDRRNPEINTLILYLSNYDTLKSNHPLQMSSKSAAVKYGIKMMKRLFEQGEEQTSSQQISTEEVTPTSSTLQDRLKMSIGSVEEGNFQIQETSADQFKKAFEQYDRHRVRGPKLDQLFDALCSIQPTSTQSERNFSLASSIATPKRSRISPEKLNAICFLKSYFKNNK